MPPQKHHYIPKFYLRKWLGNKHKLVAYGREPYSGQIRPRWLGVDSVGFEYDLYTIPGATEETKQNMERFFMGAVDTTAAKARDMLLRGQIPTGAERYAWARFIQSLLLRCPPDIDVFKTHVAQHWKTPNLEFQKRYEAQRRPHWPETPEEYFLQLDPTIPERSAIKILTDLIERESILRLLMLGMWHVVDTSNVQRTLLTSDHPVIMTNGLARIDGHFAIPISPTKLFIACMTHEILRKLQNMPVGKLVRECNDATIGQARKFVISSSDTNLSEVRRRMGKREYFNILAAVYKTPH